MKRTVYVAAAIGIVVVVSVGTGGVTAGSESNEAPLADAGLDQQVSVGATVLLDATGSRDPDGDIASYEWRIETPRGETITPVAPANPRTRFVVTESGRYEVSVTVTDDDDVTATDTLYVDVNGSEETSDSSEDSVVDIVETRESGEKSSYRASSSTPSGEESGTRCADGERYVRGYGCRTDKDPYINVNGPNTVTVGERARFNADVGGFDGRPGISWIDGADGRWAIATFDEPGEHTMTAFASDGETTLRDSTSVKVVRNRPPTVDIQAPEEFKARETVTLSAEASDPDGYIVSKSWSPSRTVTVPKDGAVTIEITVWDNEAESASDQITIGSEEISSYNRNDSTQVICTSIPGGIKYKCKLK